MKKIIFLFLIIPILAKSQDNNLVTNLQLKGGTVKLVIAVIKTNISNDTSILNMYHKWREDYIDGTVPNDNANVTISTTKTANVIAIYGLLMRLPAGMITTADFISDFRTSIVSKRAANPVLDAGCTSLEAAIAEEYSGLLSIGLGDLQSK